MSMTPEDISEDVLQTLLIKKNNIHESLSNMNSVQ